MINITFLGNIKDIQILQKNQIKMLDKQLNYNYGIKLILTQNETGDEYNFYQFEDKCNEIMQTIIENQKDQRHMILIEAQPLIVDYGKIKVMQIRSLKTSICNYKDLNIKYNICRINNEEIGITKQILEEKQNTNPVANQNENQILNLDEKVKDSNNQIKQITITNEEISKDENKIKLINTKKQKIKNGINNFFMVGNINSIEQIRFIKQTKEANHYRLGTKITIENADGKYLMYAFNTFSIELNKNINKYINNFNLISGNIEIIKGKTIFAIKNIIPIPKKKVLDIRIKKDYLTYEVIDSLL